MQTRTRKKTSLTYSHKRSKAKRVNEDNPWNVMELFAGVGGFKVALERANEKLGYKAFDVAWSSQWEPSTKRQHAVEVMQARWPKHAVSGVDISTVPTHSMPRVDVLVGGFPCQDYSVARTLNQAAGLIGKKGVLWWQIHRILRDLKPAYGIFENVDRLLKSPANQRGRDFAVMLASLAELGYIAEWRVINAADYGFPQKRRRVFITAYRKDSKIGQYVTDKGASAWLFKEGVLARALPVVPPTELVHEHVPLEGSLADITDTFNKARPGISPFHNAGVVLGREVITAKVTPHYDGPQHTLGDILIPECDVPSEYFIPKEQEPQWRFLKGAKSLKRTRKDGSKYTYDEGSMSFPDAVDGPARTIITGEGGSTPSRFKHVIRTKSGRLRRLVPIELERLNGFPDNHTQLEGITDAKRAFFMGNALVTGVVEKIAVSLATTHFEE